MNKRSYRVSPFRTTQASADWIRESWGRAGAQLCGRHLFDYTNGWAGRPPNGDHVVVVAHAAPTDWPFPDAPFSFVTTGVADEVEISLVPVVLGAGKRFFGDAPELLLDDPCLTVAGDRVTYMRTRTR